MARTLQQLKESIENLIAQQGAEAPVAAWIYTMDDVFEIDENGDLIYLPLNDISHILNEVGGGDYIHELIGEYVDNGIANLKQRVAK